MKLNDSDSLLNNQFSFDLSVVVIKNYLSDHGVCVLTARDSGGNYIELGFAGTIFVDLPVTMHDAVIVGPNPGDLAGISDLFDPSMSSLLLKRNLTIFAHDAGRSMIIYGNVAAVSGRVDSLDFNPTFDDFKVYASNPQSENA